MVYPQTSVRKLRLTSAMQAEGPWGGGRGGLLYISAAVGGDFYLSLCGGGSDCCLLRQKRANYYQGHTKEKPKTVYVERNPRESEHCGF